MTIATTGIRKLVNYDNIRLISPYFDKRNHLVEVRAYYTNSRGYEILGCYKDAGRARAVISDIEAALRHGNLLYYMPKCINFGEAK